MKEYAEWFHFTSQKEFASGGSIAASELHSGRELILEPGLRFAYLFRVSADSNGIAIRTMHR